MELFPAIDLRGGTAVRLTQGDFDREQRYGDPLALAASFITAGTPWIHVVDLDAARTGVPHEQATLKAIAELARGEGHVPVRIQTGGGIRTEAAVEALLGSGVTRVVLGTAALEDPALATRCARRWPGQVAVGLDYKMGQYGQAEALAHGWLSGSGRSLPELLSVWEGEPIGAVVATSIMRDGMLEGPDMEGMRALLETTALPVVASGGVSELSDLIALAGLSVQGRRVAGVIVGKALVEGRFTLEEALAACAASA
jgi:phosphoribosylformimino-5-aminoimidazole carboxamide ribotide isomerase